MKKILISVITILMISLTACGSSGSAHHGTNSIDSEVAGNVADDLGSVAIVLNNTFNGDSDYGTGYFTTTYDTALITQESPNERLMVFKFGEHYIAKIEGETSWISLSMTNHSDISLNDGESAYITADITRIYGMTYFGNPIIDKLIDAEYYSVKDAIDEELYEEYDPEKDNSSGPRIFGDYLICYFYSQYYVYDENGLVGIYSKADDAKDAMGVKAIVSDVPDEQITGVEIFIFKAGDDFLIYSDYAGLDSWAPVLNTDFENDFFEVADGELVHISSADLYVVDNDDSDKAVMITAVYSSNTCSYQTFMAKMPIDTWDENQEYEGYGLCEYDFGEYFIVYTDGTFHVYHDEGWDLSTPIGEFESAEDVADYLAQ